MTKLDKYYFIDTFRRKVCIEHECLDCPLFSRFELLRNRCKLEKVCNNERKLTKLYLSCFGNIVFHEILPNREVVIE